MFLVWTNIDHLCFLRFPRCCQVRLKRLMQASALEVTLTSSDLATRNDQLDAAVVRTVLFTRMQFMLIREFVFCLPKVRSSRYFWFRLCLSCAQCSNNRPLTHPPCNISNWCLVIMTVFGHRLIHRVTWKSFWTFGFSVVKIDKQFAQYGFLLIG